MMMTLNNTNATYLACPAQSFCVDFGVFRGESIWHIDDLNLGDMYQLKSTASWTEVSASDEQASKFDLNLAANLPAQSLTTLAHLIFMTTTGRRADVFVSTSEGQLYLVCDQELQTGPEYVLIHIEKRDVEFTPVVVPTPLAPAQPAAYGTSNIIPLRALG